MVLNSLPITKISSVIGIPSLNLPKDLLEIPRRRRLVLCRSKRRKEEGKPTVEVVLLVVGSGV